MAQGDIASLALQRQEVAQAAEVAQARCAALEAEIAASATASQRLETSCAQVQRFRPTGSYVAASVTSTRACSACSSLRPLATGCTLDVVSSDASAEARMVSGQA